MHAAEADFEAAGRRFRAGATIIAIAEGDRSHLESSLTDLGLSAWAVDSVPQVKRTTWISRGSDTFTAGHERRTRVGRARPWTHTACHTCTSPISNFGKEPLCEIRRDPLSHVGGNAVSQVNGIARTAPVQENRAHAEPGRQRSSEDIRGGMGIEGLSELAKFVQEGARSSWKGRRPRFFLSMA